MFSSPAIVKYLRSASYWWVISYQDHRDRHRLQRRCVNSFGLSVIWSRSSLTSLKTLSLSSFLVLLMRESPTFYPGEYVILAYFLVHVNEEYILFYELFYSDENIVHIKCYLFFNYISLIFEYESKLKIYYLLYFQATSCGFHLRRVYSESS